MAHSALYSEGHASRWARIHSGYGDTATRQGERVGRTLRGTIRGPELICFLGSATGRMAGTKRVLAVRLFHFCASPNSPKDSGALKLKWVIQAATRGHSRAFQ